MHAMTPRALEAHLRAHPGALLFNSPLPLAEREPLEKAMAEIVNAMNAVQARADAERRQMTDAEGATVLQLYAAFDNIAGQLEKPAELPDHIRLPSAGRRTEAEGGAPTGRGDRPLRATIPGQGGEPRQRVISGRQDRSFRAMFPEAQISAGGFRDAREFFSHLHQGLSHPAFIQAAAAHQEGVGEDGGYLVPLQFVADLMDASIESEIIRPRATVVPMASNQAVAPVWDMQDHTGGNIGGFVAEWMAEGAEGNIQTGKVRPMTLRANKLGIFSKATSELVADAPTFDREFRGALEKAISFKLDTSFLRGTGAGQPRGVLNDPALITVTQESGQAADTILYANLVNMFARMHPASIGNSVWVANSTAIPQLLTLSVPVSAGEQHVPVLRESDGGFTLLTRPVIFSEKASQLGDVGDIGLYDFSQYIVGMRSVATVNRFVEALWLTDEVGFRMILRATGQGKWSQAATPLNGATLSWAVVLEERAG